ncbi:Bgt-20356 [Blumeria graminis f. sp. tritici]|uniref:Bgt-20356 n=2 Tax=Blumeria graminis f. sp. tritici TaxID=62690 RepID=A0A381LG84_BLUGR|nr:Bgt-20356 [Blumeria graminis f. sp. tritici]
MRTANVYSISHLVSEVAESVSAGTLEWAGIHWISTDLACCTSLLNISTEY